MLYLVVVVAAITVVAVVITSSFLPLPSSVEIINYTGNLATQT